MAVPADEAAMKNHRLNLSWLVRTILVLAALAMLTVSVHAWQMRRHARGQLALADTAEQEQDADALVAALNRYMQFEPASTEVRARFATTLADRAKGTRERWKALQVMRQAVGKEAHPEMRLRAADLAMELGEPAEAARLLAPLLREQPKVELLEKVARYHIAAGNFPAAIRELERALKAVPDRVSSAVLLAEVHRKHLDQPALADAVFDHLVTANPGLAEARLARARARIESERLKAAEADLKKARELAPRNPAVLIVSAELATRRGQAEAACADWKEALKLSPASPAIYLGLAQAQKDCGRLAAATATLREGLHRLPKDVEMTFALADLLIEQGEANAARSLRAKLPQPAAKGRALYLDGRLAQREKRWLDAAKLYVEAIQQLDVQPELGSRLMLELARCYGELGAKDEQFLATLQAARLASTPRARLLLSELLVAAGRGEDALPLLRSLASLPTPPRDTWGLLARALLDHHRARPAWQRRWRDVETALEKVSGGSREAVSSAVIRAEMLLMRNDLAGAKRILDQAEKAHPREAVVFLAQADLAARQGDDASARLALERGDQALEDDIDWLLARAGRLAGHRDPESYRELTQLEARATELGEENADRLERHLADLHARVDNQTDVERLARRVLARHPADVRSRLLLVDALLARKADADAARLTEQLKKIEGENGAGWRCAAVAGHLARARHGQRDGLPEAHRLIDEIGRLRPGWSQASFLAARLADTEGRFDAALEHYSRVLSLGDFHPHALSRLVQLLIDRKRWADASVVLEQARSHGALDRELLRPAAWIAVRAGKLDRARELALQAVPPGRRSYRDLIWLGQVLDAADRPTESAAAFDEAIRLAPDVSDVWLARVAQLGRQRRLAEADAVLEQMSAALPEDRRELALARAQESLARFDDAEKTYRTLLAHEPNDAEVLQRLANLLVRRNEPVKAEEAFKRLLRPRVALPEEDIPDLRRQLALAITAPEQTTDRVTEALTILAWNRPSEADRRVAALARARRPTERAAAIKELESLPGGPAVTPDERLRLARLYDAQGAWPQARTMLLALLAEDESNGALMAVLIDGLLRAGKKSEAATWLDRLEKLEGDSSRVKAYQERLKKGEPRAK